MSARDDLIFRITRHCSVETAEQLVEAYRVEVLTKAGVKYEDCPVCRAAQPVGGPCGICAFKARMAAETGGAS